MKAKTIIATAAAGALLLPGTAQAAGPPADVPRAPAGTPAPQTVPAPAGQSGENDPGAAAREQALTRKPATTGPNASAKAKSRAYGAHCKKESKKRAAGEKGTPFSRCVTAMARLGSGKTSNPRTACKDVSRKRTAGEKGTPFSRCVSAAAKLREQQQQQQEDEEQEQQEQEAAAPEVAVAEQ
jgi:hypothetical protein